MRLSPSSSLRRKLLAIILLTTLVALLVAVGAMVGYDLRTYQRSWTSDMATQAELLGRTIAPALSFDDPRVAKENLDLLKLRPRVRAAAIYTTRGKIFARYASSEAQAHFPALPEGDGTRVDGQSLVVFKRIVEGNQILGTVYLRADYALYDRIRDYLGISALVMAAAMLVALLMSTQLQRVVTRPVLYIAGIAREVMERRDYSRRAEKVSDDEVGVLVEAFNGMLTEIERRTAELEASNRELAHEVAERSRTAEALVQSEERYRTLVAALTSVIWSADPTGRFRENEHSWSHYTGQTPAEYLELGWRNAIHTGDRARVESELSRAGKSGKPVDIEIRLWHAASEEHHDVTFRAIPVGGAGSALREWVGSVTDIHDRRQAEREILRLNAELEHRVRERTAQLESANKELEAFCYSVSHDLRAPLRAIDGFSHALLEDFPEDIPETGHRYLNRIRSSAQRMAQLIDDLLNLSRVSRTTLELERVDVSELARQVIAELRQGDPDREVEVSVWDGMAADADPRMLRIVLENLIGNAWKFTSRTDAPRIEIGWMRDAGRVIFFVRDNGAGFDMAYADKLFTAFQRLHAVNDFAGTGIGLATVQRVVYRHGGRIWADAQENKGAAFFFTLSYAEEEGGASTGTEAGR